MAPLTPAERTFLLAVALTTIVGTGISRVADRRVASCPGLRSAGEIRHDDSVVGTVRTPEAGQARADTGGRDVTGKAGDPKSRPSAWSPSYPPSRLDDQIRRVKEAVEHSVPDASPGSSASGSAPVELNTASASELAELPGLGPVLAARIVEDRRARGPFRSVEDLRRVQGVGPGRVERLRRLVMVAPP